VAGVASTGYTTALQAAAWLEENDQSFWSYGKMTSFGDLGGVSITTGYLDESRKDGVFVLYLTEKSQFPAFLKPVFKKHFFGRANCVRCLQPMNEPKLRVLRDFDDVPAQCRAYQRFRLKMRAFPEPDKSREQNFYLACSCGYPVWRLDEDSLFAAERAISQAAAWRRRSERIKAAGGSASQAEIQKMFSLQAGRCFYCNREFTREIRPTIDHILPVSAGGTMWAMNILFACKSCNSSRCDIPFRTYCRLLSRTQNLRILKLLRKRLLEPTLNHPPEEGMRSFAAGLASHNPKHPRYRDILSASATKRRNAANNQLLPRTVALVVKKLANSKRKPKCATKLK
jgi:hypothetical protein